MNKIKKFLQKIWGKIDPYWILLILIFIFFVIMAKMEQAKEKNKDYGFSQNKSVVYVILDNTFYFIFPRIIL